ALVFPFTASAQSLSSPYQWIPQHQSAGVFAQYMWPSGGRLGAGPNAGPGVGLRWGIDISGPLALDIEASYSPLTRPVVDTAAVSVTDSSYVVKGEADMNLIHAGANVRFNLTGARSWHAIQPFVLFGGGLAINLSGENGDDTKVARDVRFGFGTSFAGQLGAGFEWFATPAVAARFDGGMLLWKLKAPSAFIANSGADVIPASEWERNFKVSAGLAVHF
ncbi:MAG: hypothetical protein ABIV28_06580, partial [Longimicrobiales bacterium]